MRKLVRLVPAAGAFGPFMGCGTAGIACVQMELSFIGVGQNAVYHHIAQRPIVEAASG
jgi:DNA modification methylase